MKLTTQVSLLNRVSFQDKLLFTKHLDTMVRSGITISEALDTLIEQTKSEVFKKVLRKILKDIENGQPLASALKKHPKVFSQFYSSLISVGEESGTLEDNLKFLAIQLNKDYRLRKKVKGALIYPALVVAAMGVMGGFISFFVLPKLVEFFSSFEVELPLTTKMLLVFANLMKGYGHIILPSFIILLLLLRLLIKQPKIKPKWHALILKTPMIGNLLAYTQLARFSRNFGTLIKSGVPISQSLDITAETLSNLKFKNDLLEVSKSLTKGKNIGMTLKANKYSEYPPLVSRMIAIGEKTGKLDETLLYLSDYYEDEIDDLSKNLSTVIEPILLIGIGIGVGFIAVAIISPIYELTGSVRR